MPHELRYTAASAVMTLDRYGPLFGDELDAVADRRPVRRLSRDAGQASGLQVRQCPRQDSNLRHTV